MKRAEGRLARCPRGNWVCHHGPQDPVLAPFLMGWPKSGCAKETPSGQEGIQAGPQPTERQNHPLGWLTSGTEAVECAIEGQSLLAAGRRQARRKEVIERSNP